MTITKSDLRADVVLQTSAGSYYGYQLMEEQWHVVNGSGKYFWVYRSGRIANNKFVADQGDSSVQIEARDSVLRNFAKVWTPEPEFREGDVLVAADGTVVIVGKTQMFWYARPSGGWDYSEIVVRNHGKLSRLKNNLGESFTGAKVQ